MQASSAIEPHLRGFFDRNHDRRISLAETYRGLRELGIGRLGAAAVAAGINVGLGLTTGGGLLTVDLDAIARRKHAGDTGVIRADGSFDEAAFDRIFARYARKHGDALTREEVAQLRADDLARDEDAGMAARLASLGELGLLFRLGAEDRAGEPVLTRERLRAFYTDSGLFETLAAENRIKQASRGGTLGGALRNAFATWIF